MKDNCFYRSDSFCLRGLWNLPHHAAVAFLMLWWATGSMALGGLAALLEPVLNVIALPYHDRLWGKLEARLAVRPAPAGAVAAA